MRRDVWFASGGDRCAAWLYLPEGGEGPSPCIVLAHGFGATRAARLGAYAERFAEAGFAALVFDYRHFGDSEGEPRQLLDIGRQLDDWRAAIAFARTLPEVDPDQVAAWGSSFSGGHVIVIAAEDQRLAGAISQNPFVDGPAALWSIGLAGNLRLARAGLRDEWARLRGRPPHTVPIVGPAGTTGVMTREADAPGYAAMFDPRAPWVNEVAARIGLRVGFYRPATRAPEIGCPWLVQVAEGDEVTPPRPAIRAAVRAPWSQLRRYPGDHWAIYGEGFERAVADQVGFLRRVLRAPAGVAA